MANEAESKGRPEKNLRAGPDAHRGQQGGGGRQTQDGQTPQQQQSQSHTPAPQGAGKSRMKATGTELLEGQGGSDKRSKRKP